MIQRKIIDDLLRLLNHFPAVGIIGPRQCGKTTLAKAIMSKIERPCIYLDLELFSDASKLEEPELFFQNNKDKCIVLDEIQHRPELFLLLRSVIDQDRIPARFIILGSASPVIMRNTSESLAGRIAYKELYPFNLMEVNARDDMKTHWLRGGYPGSFLNPEDEMAETWLDSFITTYIERDLPFLGLNATPALLRKFWTMLAGYHGGILNASSLSSALDISAPTVRKYIYFLENAFLIRTLPPFFVNFNKRLVKAPKIYIRDSGVLHFLRHISCFESLENNVLIGASWEGYVLEQIIQLLPTRIQHYYYRTQAGTECDLILAKGDTVVAAIEIKYSSAPEVTKGFIISIQDLSPQNAFIVTPFSDDFLIRENIRVCNLVDFITIHLPKLIS